VRPGQQEARDLLGAIFRAYRVKAGLSRAEVARRSGLHANTVNEVERGTCGPRMSTVFRLCEGLEINPAVLSDGSRWNREEDRWEVDADKLAAYRAEGDRGNRR